MQHTTTIPRTGGAALRVWVFQGLWRGALVGAMTPIVGFVLAWAVSAAASEALPAGTTTASSLDGAGVGEVLVQLGGLALYAGIAAAIGAPVGALTGAVVGVLAGAADVVTRCRVAPTVLAAAVVVAAAAGTWWLAPEIDPDGPAAMQAVVLVPFVLGLGTIMAVRLRRDAADTRSELTR